MRIVARLLVLLPLLWVEGVWAVDCASSNYTLASQAQVDDLGATGCNTVLGDLTIEFGANVASLDNLATLTYVGGGLSIQRNDALAHIDGLANLAYVGDYIYISGNAALMNLDGLVGLSGVPNGINIRLNPALTNIDGLANLTTVGPVVVYQNAVLTNLDGLVGLTGVDGYLDIHDNGSLTNLDGLASVWGVVGDLNISFNGSLTNLDGLASVNEIEGDLTIAYEDALVNIDGLANLYLLEGDLSISNNIALTDVDGLIGIFRNRFEELNITISGNRALRNIDGLAAISGPSSNMTIDNLVIRDNTVLTNLDRLYNLTSVGGDLHIFSNTALVNLNGLSNLTRVGGDLAISVNALIDLDGLARLASVGGDLNLTLNPALTNLDGLANLTIVEGHLDIGYNAALTNCQGLAPVLGWPSGPPEDGVAGSISLYSNASGCNSVQVILNSVAGVAQPIINQATISGASISLAFTPSTTTDTAFPVTGYNASCIRADTDASATPFTNLLDNTPVQETLTISGYDPSTALSSIEVDLDITHSDPTDLSITLTTPEGTELTLWNQGSSGGEDIVGTFPTTLMPVDSFDTVTRQTMDGDWTLSIEDINVGPLVREGVLNSWGLRITEELSQSGSGSPIEVLGATRGRNYSCTVAPVTKLPTSAVSDPYTVSVPLELPSVPTITSTDYEDGKIILRVSVSDNGGTGISEYEAICTDGTNTYTGTSTSSPITVSGLTNDVAYTCTVTATNLVGESSASAATDPITPEETSAGLPIWLLYQATQ